MRLMFACLSVYYRYSQEEESSLYPCLSIVDIYSLLHSKMGPGSFSPPPLIPSAPRKISTTLKSKHLKVENNKILMRIRHDLAICTHMSSAYVVPINLVKLSSVLRIRIRDPGSWVLIRDPVPF